MIIGLTISALANIFLVWYLIKVLKKLYFVSNNINDLLHIISDYSTHLEKVYNMETYYGDQTLQMLLEHSKDIVKELETYEEIYSLTEEGIEEDIEEGIEE